MRTNFYYVTGEGRTPFGGALMTVVNDGGCFNQEARIEKGK